MKVLSEKTFFIKLGGFVAYFRIDLITTVLIEIQNISCGSRDKITELTTQL